jgi:hypothetical protein
LLANLMTKGVSKSLTRSALSFRWRGEGLTAHHVRSRGNNEKYLGLASLEWVLFK